MAYFDNGNYNFDDLFNELNRDFSMMEEWPMVNNQWDIVLVKHLNKEHKWPTTKGKPIGVDLTEQAKRVNMILSLDVQLLLTVIEF